VSTVSYAERPILDEETLNALFARAWPSHKRRDFHSVLEHSLTYWAAFADDRLVGFVNVATDGGHHAFLLDPTVDPSFQRQGIGLELVRRATDAAAQLGPEWLHVDYEAAFEQFYRRAGFRHTAAGLINLKDGVVIAPSNGEL
jgi:ribosomal protein S18 acetylase RimI-like enzyme